MPEIDLADITLYYELHGNPDGVPILVISGTGGDLRRSRPELSPLNTVGRTCHYDQRGLGQSGKPDGPYTMADYADDAAHLMTALGWERAHVVGTSFGGMVALNLVTRHPERVDRLVLNCTSPGGDRPSFPLDTLAELDLDERVERTLAIYDTRYVPGAATAAARAGVATETTIPGLSAPAADTLLAGMRTERHGADAAGYRNQLGARTGHDVTAALAQIASPTLVCAGRFDSCAPVANAEYLAEHIPDARLEIFDGGHFFTLQDRRAFPVITQFLTDGF